jgi:hypothetical protein
MGLRLSVDAAGTAKIGKCFHTGNMGFPYGGREEWISKVPRLRLLGSGPCLRRLLPREIVFYMPAQGFDRSTFVGIAVNFVQQRYASLTGKDIRGRI